MTNTRRIKRMSRNRRKIAGMNLVSLMDVFTILVFFLLVNSASSDVLEPPREIALPDSIVEEKPRETVVIFVSPESVLVQGEPAVLTAEIMDSDRETIEPIQERLLELSNRVIGISTKTVAESSEVTILADKAIPFKVLKKIMTTCTSAGYGKISLAVIQKASQT